MRANRLSLAAIVRTLAIVCVGCAVRATAASAPLEPVLDADALVPNGGIFRFFDFGGFKKENMPRLAPYEKFPEQVAQRGVSGLTLHNFTAKDRSSLVGVKRVRGAHYLPGGIPLSDETYARVRHAIAAVGYRLVLGSPRVERVATGVRASFTLTNVGVSRMFHDYNRVHLLACDADGRLVEDRPLGFRLASLAPAARPLAWDEAAGARFSETFPATVAEVRVRIPDEKRIEHPLCLSNRGRDADGAYSLGRVWE